MHLRSGLLAGMCCLAAAARAEEAKPAYPAMAPLAQYAMSGEAEEAMARSAAPPSVAKDAEIMVLGSHGYETVAKGRNGFVCMVQRAWANDLDDAEFWNPKIRGPLCFNPLAANTVLPTYLERTGWVLAGVSRSEMAERAKVQRAAHKLPVPQWGAMSYMMSKQGYLSDAGSHWRPHLMFYLAGANPKVWGANLPGSPVMADNSVADGYVTFFIPVAKWSDESPAAMDMH